MPLWVQFLDLVMAFSLLGGAVFGEPTPNQLAFGIAYLIARLPR